MQNKCSECDAILNAGQRICPYCKSLQTDNTDETLLNELMIIKRKYEIPTSIDVEGNDD